MKIFLTYRSANECGEALPKSYCSGIHTCGKAVRLCYESNYLSMEAQLG